MSGPISSVTATAGRKLPWARVCETKPISRGRSQWPRAGDVAHAGAVRPKRAKQSQFPAATGAGTDGEVAGGAVVGTGGTNKAHSLQSGIKGKYFLDKEL